MKLKRSWASTATAALFCLCLTSCYKATFQRDASVVKGEEHSEWTDFYLFGLVGTEEFAVTDFCPDGNAAQVQTGGNFATGLVGAITFGIYTPRKVYVTCGASETARRLELDMDASGRPVHAQLTHGSKTRVLSIDPAGAEQWKLSMNPSAGQGAQL